MPPSPATRENGDPPAPATGDSPSALRGPCDPASGEQPSDPPGFLTEDPFADVDWDARREAILDSLPDRPPAPPPTGWVFPGLAAALEYAMPAAALVLAVSLLLTMVQQHESARRPRGAPGGDHVGAPADLGPPLAGKRELREVGGSDGRDPPDGRRDRPVRLPIVDVEFAPPRP